LIKSPPPLLLHQFTVGVTTTGGVIVNVAQVQLPARSVTINVYVQFQDIMLQLVYQLQFNVAQDIAEPES
jgi:hypothetical protein